MIPSRRQFLKHMARVLYLCVLLFSFLFAGIAYSLPEGLTFTRLMALRITLGNCLLFALLFVAWHYLFVLCGLYVSKRMTGRVAEVLEVCKATLLACVLLICSAKLFHIGI